MQYNFESKRCVQNIPSIVIVQFQSQERMIKKLNHESFTNPREEMNKRWIASLAKGLPTIDLLDLSNEALPFRPVKR